MADKTTTKRGTSGSHKRLPVRLHRNISILLTRDHSLDNELLTSPRISKHLAGQLADGVLVILPGQERQVADELKRIGQTPQIIKRGSR